MLGTLVKPDYEKLIRDRDWEKLRAVFDDLEAPDLAEVLEDFPAEDAALVFRTLRRDRAAEVFEYLPLDMQTKLVQSLADKQMVKLLNDMAPDDRTRLLEELPPEVTKRALASLSPSELKIARQLLGYPENSAGRYMTPEYMAVRPLMTAAEALAYVRKHGKHRETLNVIYVTDEKGLLHDDLTLAALVMADPETKIRDINSGQLTSIQATLDREEVVAAFEKYDRVALPVTDSKGIMLGIITVDDVLDVVEETATEDIQKLGGMQALEAPYLDSSFWGMIRKRAGWLSVLFVGEMLTATAMGYFQSAIERIVVLAVFVPLIISSGGNSGSQATSLIIRSLAVRELDGSDWLRVLRREALSGVVLGSILGLIGFLRIATWPGRATVYGPYYFQIAITVAISLVGVVTFGTLCGSMLPFLLRRLKLDPATASAPFVATLVDVSGLVIYFSTAMLLLRGMFH